MKNILMIIWNNFYEDWKKASEQEKDEFIIVLFGGIGIILFMLSFFIGNFTLFIFSGTIIIPLDAYMLGKGLIDF